MIRNINQITGQNVEFPAPGCNFVGDDLLQFGQGTPFGQGIQEIRSLAHG